MISLKKASKRKSLIPFVLLCLMILTLVSNPGYVPAQNLPDGKSAVQLPTIKSMDQLRKLLNENGPIYRYYDKALDIVPTAAAPAAESQKAVNNNYSSTNVQVEGVDEADLIKTDGTFIYQISNNSLMITRAVPADKMQVMTRINYENANFSPIDFYITGNKLLVIGSGLTAPRPVPLPMQTTMEKMIAPPYYSGEETTHLIVYNCADKTNPIKERELEIKGNYLTSRRIGQTLYLISNNYLRYYPASDEVPLPEYKDSAVGPQFNKIPCEKIRYFPGCNYYSYIVAAALQIDQPAQAAKVDSYLGTAENVYASANNLYIAIPAAHPQGPVIMDSAVPEQSMNAMNIYRFSLNNKQIDYAASGSVPGRILNQFSMDEYNHYFRIATTTDKYNGSTSISSNNIYVLDESLQMKGKIENIAPGEFIYAARFTGERAYLVTFRTVDPFFVIDLADPLQPKILGKLKIPGYSNYLHPYDNNHIIGFGKDTIETKGYDGNPQAYYMGMKVAMFDVTNVENPIEMAKVNIGDRGTDSELLNNHRALLFAKDKNLLAFPVTVAKVNQASINQPSSSFPAYGTFEFQGAYIYSISLKGGLQYKGRITHLSKEDYLKAGDYMSDPGKSIHRIIYIGDNLYTISDNMIQAHQIDSLKLVGNISL